MSREACNGRLHGRRPDSPGRRIGRSLSPFNRPLRLEALESRRLLAGVVVGNALDVVNGNTVSIANLIADNGGDGISLREAILAANATAGADVITFAPALSGQTITLGGTELTLPEALTIDARPLAANVTIDAHQASRIFNITAPTGDFTLGGLTLINGRTTANVQPGGAILALTSGLVTVDQSTVAGNSTMGSDGSGGGIFSLHRLTMIDSIVSGNSTVGSFSKGGGIYSFGLLTLTRSTVSGNMTTGGEGGGIWCDQGATLLQSTVSGNRAQGADGGGIVAFYGPLTFTQSNISENSAGGRGGGIVSWRGAITLTQSTVSGNSTTGFGGGIYASGDLTLTQSTLSGNTTAGIGAHGGGIWAFGTVTLAQSTVTNNRTLYINSTGGGVYQPSASRIYEFSIRGSIVAGNTAMAGGNDLAIDFRTTLTVDYSLIGTGVQPDNVGNNIFDDNPQLAPLADNGGQGPTHATLAASLAINAGDPTIAADPAQFDGRGAPFVRVFGGRIDIGAYERQTVAGLNLVVDTASDEIDGDLSAGNLSLREAIGLANGSIGANTIGFAPALSGRTINLTQGELLISDAVSVNGPGAGLLAIRAFDPTPLTKNGDGSRIFMVDDGAATVSMVSISGLNLTGGDIAGHGGAIFNRENLSIASSTISGNYAQGSFGGGLYNGGASGVLALNGVTVSNNLAVFGGGVMNIAGTLTVTNSTISGNAVSGNGGGIQNNNGTLNVSQSTISGNNGAGAGGGILTYYDVSTSLTNVTISGNSATQGGGLWARASHVNVAFSTITGNSAGGTGVGGGVRLIYPVGTTLDHAIVAGNIGAASLRDDIAGAVTARFSLIGDSTGATITNNGGNLIGTAALPINPLLGPLATNGGSTQTHALLVGSPAIDAGDPGVVFNPAQFDQRGAPFVRVFDGAAPAGARVDIGAVELQPIAPSADFDSDTDVDGVDFLTWQRGFGLATSAVKTQGNADGDGDVDGADLVVWRAQFGDPPGAFSSGEAALATPGPEQAADAVFASGDLAALLPMPEQRTSFRPRRPWRR